jgi:cell division protein FtsQ
VSAATRTRAPAREPVRTRAGLAPRVRSRLRSTTPTRETRERSRDAEGGPVAPGRVLIDPRIRERRAAVLRRQARRRLRTVACLLAVVVVLAGGWLLLHSRLFSARVVTVVGSVHTPRSEIIAVAGLADRPPLIDVNGSAAARLERLPWVASATVVREWPDGVRITVVERAPVAAMAVPAPGSGWAVLDRSGKVLADTAGRPSGLVEVAGTAPPGAPGTTDRGARAAVTVAASLPPALQGEVAEVLEGAGGTVTLHLTSPLTVDLGSTVDLNEKYEDVAAILAGAPLAAGDVIDVTAPGDPVVSS